MSNNTDIPVVIFCGGAGTRMRGGTLTKKELVEVGDRPILWHVMRIFSAYGHNHFVLPLGYAGHQIRRYFYDYEAMTRDVTLTIGNDANQTPLHFHNGSDHAAWRIDMVETGLNTDKASRIARVADYLAGDRFFVTYGDGVGDVDLAGLVDFHLLHGKLATVTAIRPKAYQYGVLHTDETDRVTEYQQYPPLPYWINGGFMLFERAVLDLIGAGDNIGDDIALETGVMRDLVAQGELMVYRHNGFWRSMDTLKDALELEEVWQTDTPWKVW
ncbi:MAG: sugar phosphate nucleotidyltransferase [Anaerolineae bacterium]|nr:sugar phosphate nucleotidyltransferase [Anaerolineae bacterium]